MLTRLALVAALTLVASAAVSSTSSGGNVVHGARMAAPLLGQHTQTVVKDFLGCSDAEYQALVDSGALQ